MTTNGKSKIRIASQTHFKRWGGFPTLAAIPENADFHTPENPLLLWKSYVGISAA
jgi:hypothetical protein